MIIERKNWEEYRDDGSLLIKGEIGIIGNMWKHFYNYRTEFEGYKGLPICRLGTWIKYNKKGKIEWTINYNDYGVSI